MEGRLVLDFFFGPVEHESVEVEQEYNEVRDKELGQTSPEPIRIVDIAHRERIVEKYAE